MHTFKKKKSDGQKDDMRFLTLVTGNFHGILHHVLSQRYCDHAMPEMVLPTQTQILLTWMPMPATPIQYLMKNKWFARVTDSTFLRFADYMANGK